MGDVKRAYRAPDAVLFNAPAQVRQWPIGAWGLGALVLLVAAIGLFLFSDPIGDDWFDDRLLFALPFFWLVGLVWKGVRRG